MIASAVMLAATLLGQAAPQTPPSSPAKSEAPPVPPLSEVDALRVENHRLKLQAAQLEIRLRERMLSDERQAIEAALARSYRGYTLDWNTGALVKSADESSGGGK